LAFAFVIGGFTRPAAATVDLTGAWYVEFDVAFPPEIWNIVQNNGQLTVTFANSGPYTGTIDDTSGFFDVDLGPSPVPGCNDGRLTGTGAQDSRTFTGSMFTPTTPHCGGMTINVSGSRCGNGVLDAGEQCDDGNRAAGDCCSPTCTFEASGNACTSDSNACTDDTCDNAGTCQHTDNTAACTVNNGCVAGTCSGGTCTSTGQPIPAGTSCDSDASVCTLEACDGAGSCQSAGNQDCSPCGDCDPQLGCVGYPNGSCSAVTGTTKAAVTLKTGADPEDKRAAWSWVGTSTLATFGNPTTTTDYTFCIYELNPNPNAPSIVHRAAVPAGGTCGTSPCWQAKTNGFAYKNRDLTPDGIAVVKLKAPSTPDRFAKVTVKGKGGNLPLAASLPTGVPLEVHLESDDLTCWESTFTTPTTSTPSKFKAKYP
jgi:cysteine-rich repeat protein